MKNNNKYTKEELYNIFNDQYDDHTNSRFFIKPLNSVPTSDFGKKRVVNKFLRGEDSDKYDIMKVWEFIDGEFILVWEREEIILEEITFKNVIKFLETISSEIYIDESIEVVDNSYNEQVTHTLYATIKLNKITIDTHYNLTDDRESFKNMSNEEVLNDIKKIIKLYK